MSNKKDFKLSDVYARVLKLVDPIKIGNIKNECFFKDSNIYKIYSDYDIKDINLPPIIVEQTRKIDKDKLLANKFSNIIIDFFNTIIKEMPQVDLSFFYNNINSLKISNQELNSGFSSSFTEREVAKYYHEKNCIILNKAQDSVLFHELFHMSSSFFKKEDNIIFCGFLQYSNVENFDFGDGLNEGYTQLLTKRYFGKKYPEIHNMGYNIQSNIAKKLEDIVGQKQMEQMFFSANLYGLIENLEQYESEENVLNFISQLDFINDHLYDKNKTQGERSTIANVLTTINQFLIKCYGRKLEKIKDMGIIDNEEMVNKLRWYILSLGNKIDIVLGKNIHQEFTFLNKDSINKALSDVNPELLSMNDYRNVELDTVMKR